MSFMQSVCREVRQSRACMSCSLIKTAGQFETDGCDNCESFLHLKNDLEQVYRCTSSKYDGMIAAMNPEDSWVCKWQRIDKLVRGVYAISVSGKLPTDVITQMKKQGIPYVSREKGQ